MNINATLITLMDKLHDLKIADFSGANDENALERIQLSNQLGLLVSQNLDTISPELYTRIKGVLVEYDIFVIGNCWRIPDQHFEIVWRNRNLLSKLNDMAYN